MSRGQVMSTSAVPTPSVSSGGKLTTRPLPPPPVPPRPSKSLVAAALARSRSADVCKSDRPNVPTRKAPPPPTAPPVAKERTQDVSKSQVLNHGLIPQERTQQFHKILNHNTEVLPQGNGVGYRGEPLKNLGENGATYSHCYEATALHLGKRVTRSSVNGEGRRKGDFESCTNASCLSGKSERRDAEEFRKVHHSKVSCNSGNLEGRSGQLLALGNRVMTGDDSTLLEIKCDPRLEERNGVKFHDSQKKTDMQAVTQSLSSEERLPVPKSEEHEISVVSHVITNPQNQETVSFPQRNGGNINERTASNDHRQQTGTLQEVQNHCSRTQHAIILNGRDEYTRSKIASDQGGYCENKPATTVKQNCAVEDKQQKIRARATHMLPTGQHRHDSTYISSSGSRNTILLVDNSPSKRDKLHPVSQNRPTDNKNLTVNGIVASSCCPLVENLIVELKESSQQRTHLQCNNASNGSMQTQNGVNSSGNKENEFIESLYKKSSQPRIQHSDWFEVDNGKPVRYSSCHITLEDSCTTSSDSSNTESSSSTMDLSRSNSFQYTDCSELSVDVSFDYRAQLVSQRHPAAFISRRNMASLQGLPPLPKSLSGINLFETCGGNLHFSPMDQQQLKQDASTPRGLTKSGSFRQLASQNSSGSGGGAGSVGSNSGAVRVVPSSSGRGPTPPTPGGTSHKQILHHQHLRSHQQNGDGPAPPIVPRVRKPTGLDAQLAILRKEMVSSRHFSGCDVLCNLLVNCIVGS